MDRAAVLFVLVSAACGSAAESRVEAAPPGREPPGRRLASYRATGCVDGSGAAFPHTSRSFLVLDAANKPMLVVQRPSHDSLVLREPKSEGAERVFQAVVQNEAGARVLQDYRLPASGSGDGRMAVASDFVEHGAAPGPASAKIRRPAFACRLAAESAP